MRSITMLPSLAMSAEQVRMFTFFMKHIETITPAVTGAAGTTKPTKPTDTDRPSSDDSSPDSKEAGGSVLVRQFLDIALGRTAFCCDDVAMAGAGAGAGGAGCAGAESERGLALPLSGIAVSSAPGAVVATTDTSTSPSTTHVTWRDLYESVRPILK